MKAAQLNSYGGQSAVSTHSDVNMPEVQPGEVLVEVHAASVNPFDWKVREGYMQEFIPLTLPATLGGDVAGTVSKLGSDVTGFEVGQEVYGMANAISGEGSFAEYTAVKTSQLAEKPRTVDFNSAAALPLTAVSAYQALVDHMNLQPGQKILIHGGAGGIGTIAIQIAKNLGAQVATTAVEADHEYVKSLGAEIAVDYTKTDFSQELHDYDAVFDTIGGETNKKSYAVLKNGGVLVSMVDTIDDNKAQEKQVKYFHQSSQATQSRLGEVSKLVDDGKIKVFIDKVFPLDEAAEALEYLKSGHPKGKVVLTVR